LARHFIQISTAASAGIIAEEGLRSGQFSVLALVGREPDIDQNAIAARMGVDRARVSQLVDELETQGLIGRCVNGEDRRVRFVRLTRRGDALRARLQPKVRAAQMRVLAPLEPHERELFLDLLVRVIRGNRGIRNPDANDKRDTSKVATSSGI
jgi:DNA-binding MarR family transcriptional regulator